MKGWGKRCRQIKEEMIGRTGKRALLVEGADDVSFFRILLTRKLGANWESAWVLAEAGNKKIVTDILAQETARLGIVDRDEWTDELITAKQAELGNLFVLPRFCMESYAVDPAELWEALPPRIQGRVAGGLDGLKGAILRDKDQWLRHGVLWAQINPLWSGLRALGFKEKLLGFDVAQEDHLIKSTLREWHYHLDPDRIFDSFTQKMDQVATLPVTEQLHRWIHGKNFFLERVHPVLNDFLGQTDSQGRLMEIFRNRSLPDGLEPLWSRIR